MSVSGQRGGGIVYMIMPDRFAIGGGKTSEQKLAEDAYGHPEIVRRAWHDRPVTPPMGMDYFGGDLQGIIDRLGYLQGLGVDTLYLTPIFRAVFNNKYDVVDHFQVDPMFGDLDTLKTLIVELRSRGMSLILDAVINHVGDQHPWFLAAKSGAEPFRDYFYFRADGSYACWWDFRHLPELNIEHNDVRDYIYGRSDAFLKFYLDLGIAGWRFDAAPDLGLPYIKDVRMELERAHPDAVLIGELTCFAADWVGAHGFHGCMNYFLRDAILHWVNQSIDSRQLEYVLKQYLEKFGLDAVLRSWVVLGSHDQPRLKFFLPDVALRIMAITLQFTLPGTPALYYGEEVGLEGGPDPDCRRPMPWSPDQWDSQELAIYQHFIALRKERPELVHGDLLLLSDQVGDAEFLAFMRYTDVPEEYSIILINNSASAFERELFLPYSHIYDGVILQDVLHSSNSLRVNVGHIRCKLPPYTVAILVPKLDQFSSFRFYKARGHARVGDHG